MNTEERVTKVEERVSKVEENLSIVDRSLTMAEKILKKHWKMLILIGIGYFIYWALSLPPAITSLEKANTVTYIIESGDTIGDVLNNDTLYYERH